MVIVGLILMGIILVIPSILVVWFTSEEEAPVAQEAPALSESAEPVSSDMEDDSLTVSVFRAQKEEIEEVGFEDYIAGVVASEMPASYEKEALKAQALTARTYIIRHLTDPGDINLPDGADVTDTVNDQVYHNNEELKQRWPDDYDWMMEKIQEAVHETRGQVITYDGSPITATFFSTSNGYTENSEEYWPNEIPYLRSVESPWDTDSPRFEGEKVVSISDFEAELGVNVAETGEIGEVIERTTGGRVAKVRFGDKEFTGREIRDKLELDSSDFVWQRHGNDIVLTTKGWGHGVGMSQFGADGMAREGKNYQDIIHHYYQDVEITNAENLIETIVAKN